VCRGFFESLFSPVTLFVHRCYCLSLCLVLVCHFCLSRLSSPLFLSAAVFVRRCFGASRLFLFGVSRSLYCLSRVWVAVFECYCFYVSRFWSLAVFCMSRFWSIEFSASRFLYVAIFACRCFWRSLFCLSLLLEVIVCLCSWLSRFLVLPIFVRRGCCRCCLCRFFCTSGCWIGVLWAAILTSQLWNRCIVCRGFYRHCFCLSLFVCLAVFVCRRFGVSCIFTPYFWLSWICMSLFLPVAAFGCRYSGA